MSKPLSVMMRETQTKLTDVINESGLPIDIIVYIVGDIYNLCKQTAESSYQADIAKMAESEEEENGTE